MRLTLLAVSGLFIALLVGPAALVTAAASTPTTSTPPVSAAPGLTLSAEAAADVQAGIVDPRVTGVLAWIAARHRITVSVIRTGHTEYVAGTTRVSNHWWGRAADISVVDGQAVTPSSGASRVLVGELAALTGPLAPREIGQPFPDLAGGVVFSDAAHRNHIHVGYGPAP